MPFIARYRKEATGELDEVQIRSIKESYDYELALAQRKETVQQSIIAQEKWTDELARQLEQATTLQDVEDLYLPYRPKKHTKASMTPSSMRENTLRTAMAQELPKVPMAATYDAVLDKCGEYDVPVRIYVPKADKALPVLIYYHGGGFVIDSIMNTQACNGAVIFVPALTRMK